VADYAAALLEELRNFGEVQTQPAHSDAALYHLGNNSLHADVYKRALDQPGVVVLHDAVLHHFLLGRLGHEEYVEEFVYNYGAWNGGMAEDLWQARAGSGADARYFAFPLLKRVAEHARAVIVHNPAAARAVKEHAPRTPVIEIPHLFFLPELPDRAEALRYRTALGLVPGVFVFGVFGFLRESKRLMTVLEVFARLRREQPEIALLIAGGFVSADLERAAKPLLEQPGIVYRPYLSGREFWLAAEAVDACINLRWPAAGESSGISVSLMGIGKPVLVTDSEECARFSEEVCLRVASGLEERDSLLSQMLLLTSFTWVGRAIGERAAGHVRAHHNLKLVAQQYWKTLCEYRC
jgi:glycosyltransferase involved in cell wall biosynthesis